MTYIDYQMLESANKYITVGFIVGIFFVNCVLIYKIVKKGGCIYTPKSLTMISLAIGDIFLALFSLVVHARILFDELRISCVTYRTYVVYMRFLIHFVFGTGLIMLTAELVNRLRTQQGAGRTQANIRKSILCSVSPWILGIFVVLPLTTAGVTDDSYPCFENLSNQRQRVMYGISVVLPAVVSLVIAISAMCISIPAEYYFTHSVNQQITEQTALSNGRNTNGITMQYNATENSQNQPSTAVEKFPMSGEGNVDGLYLHPSQGFSGISSRSPESDNASNYRGQGFSGPQYQAAQYPIQQQYPPPQYPIQQQYPPTQYPIQQQYPAQEQHPPTQYLAQQQYPPTQYLAQQQYPPTQYPTQQQYPPTQYAMQQQYPVQYNAQSDAVFTSPVYPRQYGSVFPTPAKERRLLLLSSIAYCACVLPFAVYTIGTLIVDYTPNSTDTILSTSFFWLSIFRSFITPCIFTDSPRHV